MNKHSFKRFDMIIIKFLSQRQQQLITAQSVTASVITDYERARACSIMKATICVRCSHLDFGRTKIRLLIRRLTLLLSSSMLLFSGPLVDCIHSCWVIYITPQFRSLLLVGKKVILLILLDVLVLILPILCWEYYMYSSFIALKNWYSCHTMTWQYQSQLLRQVNIIEFVYLVQCS